MQDSAPGRRQSSHAEILNEVSMKANNFIDEGSDVDLRLLTLFTTQR